VYGVLGAHCKPDKDVRHKDLEFDDNNLARICDYALDVGSDRVLVDGDQAYWSLARR